MNRAILQRKTFQTAADQDALKQVLAWFEDFQATCLPHDIWLQCQLALVEGVTNAIRHAHEGLPSETPVEIEVTLEADRIDMRIWDRGPGFDMLGALHHKMATTNQDSEGGRGLQIIYQVADDISYETLPDQRNCLHISKRYQLGAIASEAEHS
ncbi:anti-sigma regulatory factor [filamentous cyanobacterium CCP5]|nr:anti-sigma regulatory factor [filamentous cyanobacterium CCP5]